MGREKGKEEKKTSFLSMTAANINGVLPLKRERKERERGGGMRRKERE